MDSLSHPPSHLLETTPRRLYERPKIVHELPLETQAGSPLGVISGEDIRRFLHLGVDPSGLTDQE